MSTFRSRSLAFLLVLLVGGVLAAYAQAPTGSISGKVTDPTGAVIPGATVIITQESTGFRTELTTSGAGSFNITALIPGVYKLRVEADGFKGYESDLTVQVGRAITPLIALELGEATETVVVESGGLATVNTASATVEGIITEDLINSIPLNGRNFLDLGQLEPGVQIQDGGNFDPTKNQFIGLSIAGSTGRTTRITVDGIDISDETVGTTVTNISLGAIKEFQISRGSNDVSTELTSTGAVNVVTKSGSNDIHGGVFYFRRGEEASARIGPTKEEFERQQVGFDAGGKFIEDKLFWFVNFERAIQDGAATVQLPLFTQFNNSFSVPFDEDMASARVDWNVDESNKVFYRWGYNDNVAVASSSLGGTRLDPFSNDNQTLVHTLGWDMIKGRLGTSFRFGQVNFNNGIVDARSQVGGLSPLTLDPAGRDLLVRTTGGNGNFGPNLLSPQNTFQDNWQYRYDGSFQQGSHFWRWGVNANVVRGNVFAAFFRTPEYRLNVGGTAQTNVGLGTVPGQLDTDVTNPLNYPVSFAIVGNGLGSFSEVATQLPFGGAENTRFHWYVSDQWRLNPQLTVSLGLRYAFEAGNTNHNVVRDPLLATFTPNPDLVNSPDQDKNNFAPNVGIAWDPKGDGKSVVRLGASIQYAPNIFNNTLFERSLFINPAISLVILVPPFDILRDPVTGAVIWDGTFTDPTGANSVVSGWALGTPGLIDRLLQASVDFNAASLAAAGATGFTNTFQTNVSTLGELFDPEFTTPYSIHMNASYERELRPGLVMTVAYLRQTGRKIIKTQDINRVAAADTLNGANALAAMVGTFPGFDDSLGVVGGNLCSDTGMFATVSAQIDCTINGGLAGFAGAVGEVDRGAGIADFANNGLSGDRSAGLGAPNTVAFPGLDPNFNAMGILRSVGKSEYNALQISLRGTLPDFGEFFNDQTIVLSYSLSQLESASADGAFLSVAVNNDGPNDFFGPSELDRTNVFSLAHGFEMPFGINLSSIWRFQSGLPSSAFLDQSSGGSDEIFLSDLNGDGTIGDPLPGCNRGCFGRGTSSAGLVSLANAFNSTSAGTLGPHAQALINAGLFSASQLTALGAVIQPVPALDPNAVAFDSFMTTDVRLSYKYSIENKYTIEPFLEYFNVFNVANYDTPSELLSATLTGSPGSIGASLNPLVGRTGKAGFGSGSFAAGIPRAMQFGIKFTF